MKAEETNKIWKVVLELNKFIRTLQFFDSIQITVHPEIKISINKNGEKNNDSLLITRKKDQLKDYFLACFLIDDNYSIKSSVNNKLETSEFDLLKDYLPFILNYFKAVKNQKSYVVSHFAQSLDGKIATNSGHSKWIGNQENLIHAHRMRALCDGILVGANTYLRDKPLLTVRHVEGNDPVKIILGNSCFNIVNSININNQTLCLTSLNKDLKEAAKDDNVVCFTVNNGLIDPNEITKCLFKKGIFTLYLEGGAFTSSYFLKKKALNEIQLFLSPAIFGSGITNFSLNQIENIEEAITFNNGKFIPMGSEGIMFTGEVNYSQNGS